jgi:NAD-dependent deacetylase
LLSPEIQPNAAHRALADFESKHADDFLLVTQNIDDLHRRAGSKKVLSMHGELLKARCVDTGELFDWRTDLETDTPHPKHPMRLGRLRPHVVWFGEIPLGMDVIAQAAREADLFITIGTSGVVYPAGIVQLTGPNCNRIEINLEDTPLSDQFAEVLRGRATELVPEFLARGWH